MFFAMTYASNGDLLKFIDKMAERDIDCVQFYAAELLAAVEFLHFKVSPLELLSPYLAFTNAVTNVILRQIIVTCDHFRIHVNEYILP